MDAETAYNDLLDKYAKLDLFPVASFQALKSDALKIACHSIDFSGLVKELESWEEVDPETLSDLINLKLSCSDEFKGFSVQDVLESLIQQAVEKYVSARDTSGLDKVGKLLSNLDIHRVLNREDLEFDYPLVSPSVSLSLHRVGLMDLGSQLDISWKNAEKDVKGFLAAYVDEVAGGEGREITELLIRVGFNKQEDQMRRKRANILLEKMLTKILDRVRNGESIDLGWMGHMKLSGSVGQDWKLHTLSLVMRHRPDMKIRDAFSSHQTLRSNISRVHGVGSLCFSLLAGELVSANQVSSLISRILSRAEVNWDALLTVVTVSLQAISRIDQELSNCLRDLICESLSTQSSEAFLAGLLVSRHACLEESSEFSSYSSWFFKLFCGEGSLLSSPSQVEFFYKELTGLVPEEPEFALRAQLSNQPRVPSNLKYLSEEYRQLARTQLLDGTKEPGYKVPDLLGPGVIKLAKDLVLEWSRTEKIPGQILEASMFKQPFYIHQLLPALMVSSAPGSILYTAQGTLLEALNSKGKVPSHLYREYLAGEIQEKFCPEESINNLSSQESGVSLENLRENFKVLENLPLDFQEEIETCITSIKNITAKLISWKKCKLNLSTIMNLELNEPSNQVWKLYSRNYRTLPHPENKKILLGLILDKIELVLLSLRYILVESIEIEDLPICREILKANPKLELTPGESILLQDYFCSHHYEIDTVRKLDQVLLLLQGSEPVSPSWTGTRKLAGFRDWIKTMNSVQQDKLTLTEFSQALRVQLHLKDDSFTKVEKLILFRKLLENVPGENEKISVGLKQSFSESPIEDQVLCLLQVLRDLNPELVLKFSGDEVRTSKQALLLLQELEQGHVAKFLEYILPLAERSRETHQLLVPLPALLVLVHIDPRQLTPGLRFSLAFYDALEIVRSSRSLYLEQEYGSVYAWCRNSGLDTASGVSGQIKVGLLRLAELYLQDEFKLDSKQSKPNSILTKLEKLAKSMSEQDERSLCSPVETWFPGAVSSNLAATVQVVMSAVFLQDLQSSLRFLLTGILPILSTIAISSALGVLETGFLNQALFMKLKNFSPTELDSVLQLVNRREIDPDILDILNQTLYPGSGEKPRKKIKLSY